MKVSTMFFLYHNKFQQLSDKASDCYIESWKLKGVEKEAAIFKQKRYQEKAMGYLKQAGQYL